MYTAHRNRHSPAFFPKGLTTSFPSPWLCLSAMTQARLLHGTRVKACTAYGGRPRAGRAWFPRSRRDSRAHHGARGRAGGICTAWFAAAAWNAEPGIWSPDEDRKAWFRPKPHRVCLLLLPRPTKKPALRSKHATAMCCLPACLPSRSMLPEGPKESQKKVCRVTSACAPL